MRPISLGMLEQLQQVEVQPSFVKFIEELKKQCKKMTGVKLIDPSLYVILVACVTGYGFNQTTVYTLNNAAVLAMWRTLIRSIETHNMFRAGHHIDLSALLAGRTPIGFERCHIIHSSTSEMSRPRLRTNNAAPSLLLARTQKIGQATDSSLEFNLKGTVRMISGPAVYPEYLSMVLSLSGFLDSVIRRQVNESDCDCKCLADGVDLESGEPIKICITHGVRSRSRVVLMKTTMGEFLLRQSQCLYPSKYADRCLLMPELVRAQMYDLLCSMGYSQIRSLSVTATGDRILSPIVHKGTTRLREFRQCLAIGHVGIGDTAVTVWMVRPTLSYLQCHIVCDAHQYTSMVSLLTGLVMARGGEYKARNGLEFSREYLGDGTKVRIVVFRDAVSYALTSSSLTELGIGYKIYNISMGCSVINTLALRTSQQSGSSSPLVTPIPIFPDIRIFKALTSFKSQTVSGITFEPLMNKIVMKFRQLVRGRVVGPTVTIGRNGGFQYNGDPSVLSSTLKQLFVHMSLKMATSEFTKAIASAGLGVMGCYPCGVPKRIPRLD